MTGKVIIVEIWWSVNPKQVSAVNGRVWIRIFEFIEQVLNVFPSLVAGKLGFCSARHLSLQSQRKKTVIAFWPLATGAMRQVPEVGVAELLGTQADAALCTVEEVR